MKLLTVLLVPCVAAYDSFFAPGPPPADVYYGQRAPVSEDQLLLPIVPVDGEESNSSSVLRSLPGLEPPALVDPSDPLALSFDPVANWIRLSHRNAAKLGHLIDNCLKTICSDYMHECHWYCDPMKGIAERRWLCDECLGPYIRLCGKCFEA